MNKMKIKNKKNCAKCKFVVFFTISKTKQPKKIVETKHTMFFVQMSLSEAQKDSIFEDVFGYRFSTHLLMLKYHPDKKQHSSEEFIFMREMLAKLKQRDTAWEHHITSWQGIKCAVYSSIPASSSQSSIKPRKTSFAFP